MARNKKRVRIQSGHQQRIIERRNSSRPRQWSSRLTSTSRKAFTKRRMRKMRSAVRRSRDQPHWFCKTHRPTVAQVVYQFLERASTRGATKSQKSNATNQFRKLQRHKRLRPDVPKRIKPKVEAMDIIMPRREYHFPYTKLPSQEAEKSIEKCIYEVLSFGTVLGLLVPADKDGMTFRVSSDIALFKNEHKREQIQEHYHQASSHKRRYDMRNRNILDEPCECETKCI